MHPKAVFTVLATVATTANAGLFSDAQATIFGSETNTNIAAGLGALNTLTTIQSGVTYWLAGLGVHNVWGNIDNYGRVVISQSKVWLPIYIGQISGWAGVDSQNGNLRNFAGASMHVTDVTANTGSIVGWLLNSLQNDGSMQFCGRGDALGSNFKLYCRENCVNNGLIVFEEVYGLLGLGSTFRNYILSPSSLTPSQTITNNGAMLIRNMRVEVMQNFLGSGCWIIAQNGIMYMQDGAGLFQNPNYGPTFNGQSISFADNTGVLHMDPHVYAHNSIFGAQIYGFQSGNVLEFLEIIKNFSYSGQVLTVSFLTGNTIQLYIGAGYTGVFSKFIRQSTYGLFNAIQYNGNSPVLTRPAQCLMTMQICGQINDPTRIDVGGCDTKSCGGGVTSATSVVKVEVPATTAQVSTLVTSKTTTFASSATTSSSSVTNNVKVPLTSSTISFSARTSLTSVYTSSSSTATSKYVSSTVSTSSIQKAATTSSTVSSSSIEKALTTSTAISTSSTQKPATTSSTVSSSSTQKAVTTSLAMSTSSILKSVMSSSSSSAQKAATTTSVASSTAATTVRKVITSTRATTSAPAATTTSTDRFYLQSSCDGSCLGHYAADGQIFSNTYTSSSNDFDTFYMNGTQLYDYTLGTLCVASESGGTQTQFQCSNDLDYINGVAVAGGFKLVNNAYLSYKSSTNWFGCGVLDLDNNYEPTGLTYSAKSGDSSNCRSCSLIKITDLSRCVNQVAASMVTDIDTLPAADIAQDA